MVDWLVVWGVAQAAGFVFKPILEDLVKESAKDYAKDFFKDCLKKVIRLPEKDVQKEAYGKALKEFLQLVQQELEDADYQNTQIKQYTQPLRKFIAQETVAAALGSAFEENCRGLDTQVLAKIWLGLNLPYLPKEFNWERVSKRYLRKVRAIVHESEKLRPIFEAQSQATVADGMQELVGIAPAFDLDRYAEGLREQYGNLKLESLDTTGVYYSELKLWRMFVPQNVRECQEFLPQVYEIPKEHGRRLRQSGQLDEAELAEAELERYRRVYVEQPIRSVLEVVGDPAVAGRNERSSLQYAVILGDPGSGKSTLLQYVALVWAERPLSELPLYPIPLLIELRAYARDKQAGQCPDILAFIHSGNITCRLNQQQLHEKLKAGQAIALFDGVDEVFDPILRDQVVTDIHRFTNDYPTVQVIVTSRWLGYKAQRLRDAGFRHFMLHDLEEEQIEAFIQRWHDLTFLEGADKQRKRERLQKAIRDSKAIRELAGNPLLLTMMAILNRNQELPRDRPELYNQASRVLLHQWDAERALVEDYRLDPKTIDYRDKQAMLRKVAYHMQSSEKGLAGNIISATDLENILTEYLRAIEVEQPRTVARLMINQLRTRNFILCYLGADSYAFVHRTFLEYFCAWEFVWQFKETQTLTLEQLKTKVFSQHWQDETWHEVLQLIVGMVAEEIAGRIVNYLIDHDSEPENLVFVGKDAYVYSDFTNIFLAAKCLLSVRKRSTIAETNARLLCCLKNLTKYFAPHEPIQWGISGEVDIANLIIRVRTQAIRLTSNVWRHDPEILPWLKSLAQFGFTGDEGEVQAEAVHELARGWKDDSEILPMLRALTSKAWTDSWGNEIRSVQIAAMQELVRGWKDDPETLLLVKNFAKSSSYGFAQAAALEELAREWKNDSETLSMLKEVVQSKKLGLAITVAVRELARSWKNDPDILSILRTCADNHRISALKNIIMQELLQGWQHNSTIYVFLCECASDNSFNISSKVEPKYLPRLTALKSVIENYPDRPQTLELLHDRANNDPDEQVREFARQKLAELEEYSQLKQDMNK